MNSEIYEPREDSYLLQKYVKKYSNGLVLDVGTGTGIQAIAASAKAKQVIATDIDSKAIECAKETASIEKIKNIKFIESDLFEKVPKKKFNLIVFNPPYLPKEKHVEDISLYSAKRGTETTIRFLDEVADYMGVVLLISSSLANQNKILDAVKRNLLEAEVLETKHIFFEDIILYKITKSELLKKLNVTNAKLFSRGKRGVIIKAQSEGRTVALKVHREDSVDTIENEKRFLKILNKHNIGPKLIKHDYLMYEFVDGIFIEEFLRKSPKKDVLIVLKKIFDQLYKMDKLGINKFEMHRPLKHIIVIENNPILIDFERARYTEKPKNVTQFCDFLIGDDVLELLKDKDIKLNRNLIIKLAQDYKADPARYKKLKDEIFRKSL